MMCLPTPLNKFREPDLSFVIDTTGGVPQGVWTEVEPMPSAPSGKGVKRGGWLEFCEGNGLIYAAKGYKTTDFYSYDPAANVWAVRSGMPYTTHPLWLKKPPRKGSKGCWDGGDYIYITQGNNSLGFWRYSISRDSFEILEDLFRETDYVIMTCPARLYEVYGETSAAELLVYGTAVLIEREE